MPKTDPRLPGDVAEHDRAFPARRGKGRQPRHARHGHPRADARGAPNGAAAKTTDLTADVSKDEREFTFDLKKQMA